MATKPQHQNRWRHNRDFLTTIGDQYADWMTVVMFYAALHAVETLFAHDRMFVRGGHTQRNQTLKSTNRYKQIWRNYRPLYDAARTARYEPRAEQWIPAEEVKTHLAIYLYRLETSISKLIGENQPPRIWP